MYQRSQQSAPGFTLIEVLLALSLTLIITLNFSLLIKAVRNTNLPDQFNTSIENGMATLSYELYTAHQFSCGDTLNFYNSQDEACQVYLENGRLIMSPGQNIICHDIDSIEFSQENGLIYLTCQSGEQKRTYLIASEYEISS